MHNSRVRTWRDKLFVRNNELTMHEDNDRPGSEVVAMLFFAVASVSMFDPWLGQAWFKCGFLPFPYSSSIDDGYWQPFVVDG